MTKYLIEDTPYGFRLSTLSMGKKDVFWVSEPNGNGPIEALYALTDQVYEALHGDRLRQGTVPRTPKVDTTVPVHGRSCDHPMRVLGNYLANVGFSREGSED